MIPRLVDVTLSLCVIGVQTLYLTEELVLCDCPGLVFPSFLSSKAEMVCSGILPIDQLRDHTPPVSLVCQRIPRRLLEVTYGIQIPPPEEGEDEGRPPYAHELLASYGSKQVLYLSDACDLWVWCRYERVHDESWSAR